MTLMNVPWETITEITQYPTIQTPAGSAVVQSKKRQPLTMRKWTVSSSRLRFAHVAVLESLYDETKGGASVFEWAPPDEAAIEVRFTEPFKSTMINPTTHQVSITIEAVKPGD